MLRRCRASPRDPDRQSRRAVPNPRRSAEPTAHHWRQQPSHNMWDEDPRWHEAIYRFLRFNVAAITVVLGVWSAWAREWAMLGYWLLGLAAVFLTLCLYAAIVWTLAHSVVWLVRVIKRVFHLLACPRRGER